MKTSNKILLALFGLAALSVVSFVFAAKANDIPLEERVQQAAEEGMVIGNNKVGTIQETRQAFKYLSVGNHIRVELVQGTLGKVEVNGEENIIPLVQFNEENDTLKLSLKDENFNSNKPLTVVVEVDENLELIREADYSFVTNIGELNLGDITIQNHGYGGRMELNLQANQLNISQIGDGSIDIDGTAQSLSFEGMGSGSFDSRDLSTSEVELTANGSFDIHIFSTEKLNLNATGSGRIRYSGNPSQVNKNLVGAIRLKEIKQ